MKTKVKLFETSNHFIRYEIWKGKVMINSGWYKFLCNQTKGQIAKDIENMYKIA